MPWGKGAVPAGSQAEQTLNKLSADAKAAAERGDSDAYNQAREDADYVLDQLNED